VVIRFHGCLPGLLLGLSLVSSRLVLLANHADGVPDKGRSRSFCSASLHRDDCKDATFYRIAENLSAAVSLKKVKNEIINFKMLFLIHVLLLEG
jgi:hypothetical protein